MKDKNMPASSRPGFVKGKSILTSQLDKMMTGWDGGSCLTYFSKAVDIVSHHNPIEKLMKYKLNKWKLMWTENLVNYWAQRVVIIGKEASHRWFTSWFTLLGAIKFSLMAWVMGQSVPSVCRLHKTRRRGWQKTLVTQKLEKQTNGDLTKFSSRKCKFCSCGRTAPCTSRGWGPANREIAWQKRTWRSQWTQSWPGANNAFLQER